MFSTSFKSKFGPILLSLFGITAIILGLHVLDETYLLYFNGQNLAAKVLEQKGKDYATRSGTKTVYYPVVEYSYNDQTVKSESPLSYKKNEYKKGDEITVLIDKDNPNKFKIRRVSDLWNSPIIFCGFGFLLAILGFLETLFNVGRDNVIDRLLKTGQRVEAEIIDLYESTDRHMSNSAWYVRCKWTSPSGKLYEFSSDPIYRKANLIMKVGMKIPVYIDSTCPKEYFVDHRSFKKFAA